MDDIGTQYGWCILCFSPQYSYLTSNMTAVCPSPSCGYIYCTRCLSEPHEMRIDCPGSDDEAPRYEVLVKMFKDALIAPAVVKVTKEMWEAIRCSGDYDEKTRQREEWLEIILKELGTTFEEVLVNEDLRRARENEEDMAEFYRPLIESIWGSKG